MENSVLSSIIMVFLMLICYCVLFKGLTIFKAYISMVGSIIIGIIFSLIGGSISIYNSLSADGFAIGFLVGLIVGGYIAWRVYMFFTYIIAAFFGFLFMGLIGIIAISMGAFIILGLLGAALAIYLVYKYHDALIIILLALPVTLIIFFLNFPEGIDSLSRINFGNVSIVRGIDISSLLEPTLTFLSLTIFQFLITMFLFVWFSLNYQQKYSISNASEVKDLEFKTGFKELSIWFALLSIVFFVLNILWFNMGFYINFGLIIWPLTVYIVAKILAKIYKNRSAIENRKYGRFIYWAIWIGISTILIPVLIQALDVFNYLKPPEVKSSWSPLDRTPHKGIILWFKSMYYQIRSIYSIRYSFVHMQGDYYWGKFPVGFVLKAGQSIYYFILVPMILNFTYKRISED